MKKKLKLKIQKDWMFAFTVTLTFLALYIFDVIDWSWYWLVSPIWILASIYFTLTISGMIWWFGWGKKQQKKNEWKN